MKKILTLLTTVLCAATLIACNKTPNNEPTPPTNLDNEIKFGSDQVKFQSVITDKNYRKGFLAVLASQDKGITTTQEMSMVDENGIPIHKPFIVIFNLDDIGDEVDLFNPGPTSFNITNHTTLGGDMLQVNTTSAVGISAGMMKLTLSGESLSIDLDLTATNGTDHLICNIKTAYIPDPIPTNNILALDGSVSAVKAQFYDKTAGFLTLFLTPSRISTSDNLENVSTYFMKLTTSDKIANKTKIDISQVSESFAFEYYFPLTEEKIVIKQGALEGATGWFQIDRQSDGTYAIDFDITQKGRTFRCNFEGEFTKMTEGNKFTVNTDAPRYIKSVVVDKTAGANGRWDIYISDVANLKTVHQIKESVDPVTLVFNKDYFTGGTYGFSSHDDVEIHYQGTVFNNANQKAGNIYGLLLEDGNIKLVFNLYNLGEPGDIVMTGKYEGAYTSIE